MQQPKLTTRTTEELQKLTAQYNPRRISPRARASLKKSLAEFGFLQPLVLNTRTNTLIGGHQRLSIAAELGIAEIPVLEADLDETKEKLANVALNKIKGKWNAEKLEPLFAILEVKKTDIEITGFDQAEAQEIIASLHSGQHQQADFETLIIKLNRQDKKEVQDALRKAKAQGPFTNNDNKNSNGNALERMAAAENQTHAIQQN
jgi:ParB-like chromosome segregation protein Spo0J